MTRHRLKEHENETIARAQRVIRELTAETNGNRWLSETFDVSLVTVQRIARGDYLPATGLARDIAHFLEVIVEDMPDVKPQIQALEAYADLIDREGFQKFR